MACGVMGIGKLGLGFFILVTITVPCVRGSFTPEDNYLIDCGSPNSTTIGNRTFVADTSASSTLTAPNSISASTSSSSVSALYRTARIFTQPSSYSFSIHNHGWHFIRLHFFPFVYQSYNLMTSKVTVSTQDVVLLQNFQPKGNSSSPDLKEYLVGVNEDTLHLSFVPVGNLSFAFINAIEVVSVPGDLLNDSARTVNPPGEFQGFLGRALETVYRINMGGPRVTPDSDPLWRTWVNDSNFLVNKSVAEPVSFSGQLNYQPGLATPETAPYIVYSTATRLVASNTSNELINVTWQFNVDANSSHFIRLHFCDIVSKALVDLYFNVYIGDWLVLGNFDLTSTATALAAPYYADFVLAASDVSSKLNISIGPSAIPGVLADGILNGLEIMKMSDSDGSAVVVAPPGSKKNLGVILGSVVGAIAVVIVALAFVMVRRRRLARKHHSKTWMPFSVGGLTSQSTGSRTSNGTAATSGQNVGLGYRFSFITLQEATDNFDEKWVIGVGGFGKVYKGVLRDETKVAVKRGNPKSQQGFNEFRTEIELLSQLRHRHLVCLIGYCDERNEMILVYEYMEKGTLKSHLYGSDLPSLSWKQRLEICIGSARGLHYLHTAFAKAIIHRDVKSANILLDENLMAKVADFGLSKTGPDLDQTHVSTAVKGSFGYLDPEYFRRQQLTEKSDVYSFGVVLLEVLCARPVIDPTLPREMVNLAEWAMKWQKGGELERIVDPWIAGTVRPDSLRKFGETVEKCLADYGVERPTMGDVLWNLEYVLQLQEAESGTSEVNSINRIAELSSQVQNIRNLDTATVGGVGTSSSKDLSDVSMSKVFSQLIKAEGR